MKSYSKFLIYLLIRYPQQPHSIFILSGLLGALTTRHLFIQKFWCRNAKYRPGIFFLKLQQLFNLLFKASIQFLFNQINEIESLINITLKKFNARLEESEGFLSNYFSKYNSFIKECKTLLQVLLQYDQALGLSQLLKVYGIYISLAPLIIPFADAILAISLDDFISFLVHFLGGFLNGAIWQFHMLKDCPQNEPFWTLEEIFSVLALIDSSFILLPILWPFLERSVTQTSSQVKTDLTDCNCDVLLTNESSTMINDENLKSNSHLVRNISMGLGLSYLIVKRTSNILKLEIPSVEVEILPVELEIPVAQTLQN